MKFEVSRNVENRVFSVKIKFKGYGNEDKGVSPEQEIEMIKDLGVQKVQVGGPFGTEGEEGAFIIPAKELELADKFEVTYAISMDRIAKPTDEERITEAKARCVKFEEVMEERIRAVLANVEDIAKDFTENYPEEIVF